MKLKVLTLALFTAVLTAWLVPALAQEPGEAQDPGMGDYAGEVASDFRYLANNVEADAEDIVTAPLHIDELGTLLRNPKFYYTLVGAGALFGGSFALDQTIRSHLRRMSSTDADLLEAAGFGTIGGASGLLYGYGLYANDEGAREYALTGGEGAGVATVLDLGIKAAFGRRRPHQSASHTAFFAGGQSFVSGDATPMFALATAISEYFDNAWYAAVPAYSGALTVGFGRMGHDAHWFSDIVGAALLGSATTELFIYLHKLHATEPGSFRVFPVAAPARAPHGENVMPTGMGVSYEW